MPGGFIAEGKPRAAQQKAVSFHWFPQEESGNLWKLSRSWHAPYQIVNRADPDVTVVKVYFLQHGTSTPEQSPALPTRLAYAFYWYSDKRHGAGRPPKWTKSLQSQDKTTTCRMKTNATLADQTLTATDPQPKADHQYNLRAHKWTLRTSLKCGGGDVLDLMTFMCG